MGNVNGYEWVGRNEELARELRATKRLKTENPGGILRGFLLKIIAQIDIKSENHTKDNKQLRVRIDNPNDSHR